MKITLKEYLSVVKDEFSRNVLFAISDSLIEKHMLDYVWLSGCSTNVYPIMFWKDYVEIQLDGCKCDYSKAIKRVLDNNSELFSRGVYIKNDGSCPSVIRFYFK